jgi:Concanavalin A-like lectin/glucanases superfamily
MGTIRSRTWTMKAIVPAITLVTAFLASASVQSAPVLQYLFNETGTDAIGSGSAPVTLPMTRWVSANNWTTADNHAADGSGVSGLPGDRAYYDPSLALDPGQTPGFPNSHYFGGFAGGLDVTEAQELPALTVQGWFKAPAGKPLGVGDGSYGTLIGNLGSSSVGGWNIRGQSTLHPSGQLEFNYSKGAVSLARVTVVSDAGAYSETNEWVYFALTANPASGEIQFYKGTASQPVALAGGGNPGPLSSDIISLSNKDFYLGNSGSEGAQWFQARAFDGLLDNMRVYNTVLSLNELEMVRQRDLLNVVPEPSTLIVLLGVFALLPRVRWHSRRFY